MVRTCKYREIVISTNCTMVRSNRFSFKPIVYLQAFGEKSYLLKEGVLK